MRFSENQNVCPNCGGDVIWYHSGGISRAVCRKKCQGWKELQRVDRSQKSTTDAPMCRVIEEAHC